MPFIWLFLSSTRSLERWLTFSQQDGTVVDPDLSGSPLDRNLLTVLLILGLFVLFSRSERTKAILRSNKWLVALCVYIILSVVWSNFPAISLRRCFRSIGNLLMVLVVLTESDPLGAMRALLRRVYLVHIPASSLTIKYFRWLGVAYSDDGLSEMWTGLAMHKNNLGQVAMCSGLVSLWGVIQHWTKNKLTVDLVLFVLTLWVLRGSGTNHSSTAIIAFIAGLAVLLGLQLVRNRAAKARRIILTSIIALMVLGSVASLVFTAFNTTPIGLVLEASGRDMTFTDRTYIWQDLLINAAKSPVLGVGIGAFWVGPIGYEIYPLDNWLRVTPWWRPHEGHNGYLDVYVELGGIGLALLILVIGSAFIGALDTLRYNFGLGSLRLALLVGVLMNNVAESSFLRGTHALWFVFLLVAVNIPSVNRKPPSQGAVLQIANPLRLRATRVLGAQLRCFHRRVPSIGSFFTTAKSTASAQASVTGLAG
jgi:O-antigen ligase